VQEKPKKAVSSAAGKTPISPVIEKAIKTEKAGPAPKPQSDAKPKGLSESKPVSGGTKPAPAAQKIKPAPANTKLQGKKQSEGQATAHKINKSSKPAAQPAGKPSTKGPAKAAAKPHGKPAPAKHVVPKGKPARSVPGKSNKPSHPAKPAKPAVKKSAAKPAKKR
jgi:hypothetical protein